MRHSNEEDNSRYHSPVPSNVQARPTTSIWWSRRCCIACLIYLGSELVFMHADLAILCDLEGSIVVTTTFLRTQLPCTDCCLHMKRVLFKTGSRVETDVVHAKAYTKLQKRVKSCTTYSGSPTNASNGMECML